MFIALEKNNDVRARRDEGDLCEREWDEREREREAEAPEREE
jgi:hypothetical protein